MRQIIGSGHAITEHSSPADTIARGRTVRRKDMRHATPETLERYLSAVLANAEAHRDLLGSVWRIVAAMDYGHPGLTKNAYLAHPLRVAVLLQQFAAKASPSAIALALCHNVIEVGPAASRETLCRIEDIVPGITEWVETLTVDRAQQRDDSYLAEYYNSIASAPHHVGQVKVVDKMDNLYTLCLNPSEAVRANYLREVELFVYPLAAQRVPETLPHLNALVADARSTGHQP